MAKRFAIHPGTIRSQSDGQDHYISGGRLIELYGLDFRECVIVTWHPLEIIDPELLPLFPLPDGRYKQFLDERRTADYWEYEKSRKLLIYHRSGRSRRRGVLRQKAIEQRLRSIAWHEKHWPEFRAVYNRRHPNDG